MAQDRQTPDLFVAHYPRRLLDVPVPIARALDRCLERHSERRFADGAELCRQLPERIGVAGVPVQVFTDHPEQWQHLVRFAFCKREEVIDEAIARLRKLG